MTLDVLDALGGRFTAGYLSGVLAGIDIGRLQMDDEIATLQRCAAEVVHGLAKIEPHEARQGNRLYRQLVVAETARREARPWPDEAVAR